MPAPANVCEKCGGATAVIDKRTGAGNILYRRRRCTRCRFRYTTCELAMRQGEARRIVAELVKVKEPDQ